MRIFTCMTCLAVGCDASPPAAPDAEPAGIRIRGSDLLAAKLIPALVETYRRETAGTEFRIEPSSTAGAISALLDGEADLVASERESRPSEEEQARVLHFSFDDPASRHVVAVDVVAVAVHPQNPIASLTYDQVIGVFCTGEIRSWSVLGQEDRPIHAIVPGAEAGTRARFEDFFCGPKGIEEKVQTGTTAELEQAVTDDRDAITFLSAAQKAGKLVALSPDAAIPPIRPTQDNIIRGAYPLYADLYLYTRGRPTGELAAFLAWVESPAGQEIVDEQRFVPLFLRPERLDEPRPLRETVRFEPGFSTPNESSLARLGLLVEEVRERGIRHVVLEGYTDNREPDPYALSEQRAQSVRALLAQEVPDLYFEIIPRGPKNPIGPNETPFGREVNRRVQVYLAEDEHEASVQAPVVVEGR